MFGGLCFLLRGNMLCGAGKNGFMFRVDAARAAEAEALPGARLVEMGGRKMKGFYWVDPAACDARALGRWLALAEDYVGKLPAKTEKRVSRAWISLIWSASFQYGCSSIVF